MYNKKVLKTAVNNLDKAKAPAKSKDIIVDPRGQWDHPGQVTRIPSNSITMQGVPYPVLGVPDSGQPVMMMPGQYYNFPDANYVDEYPQMKRGGSKSLVKLPKASKKGVASKAYSRSLEATNRLFTENPLFKKTKSRKNKVYDPKAKYYQDGGFSEEYVEADLSPEEIEQYKQGGYIIEDLPEAQTGQSTESVYTYSGRPGSEYKKDAAGNWLIKNKDTKGKFIQIKDPTGSRTKVLDAQATPVTNKNSYERKYDPLYDSLPDVAESTNVTLPKKSTKKTFQPDLTVRYNNRVAQQNKIIQKAEPTKNYAIVDKNADSIFYFNPKGYPIAGESIISGASNNDVDRGMSMKEWMQQTGNTSHDDYFAYLKRNNAQTTPAGAFTLGTLRTGVATDPSLIGRTYNNMFRPERAEFIKNSRLKDYGPKQMMFTLIDEQGKGSSKAVHGTGNEERIKAFNTPGAARNLSNGCINVNGESICFDVLQKGSGMYILPEENKSLINPGQSFLKRVQQPSQYKEGGEQEYIEMELTPDQIEQYKKGGYIIEDISVPSLTKAQKGGSFYTFPGSEGVYRKVGNNWEVDWNKSGNFQPLSKGDVNERQARLNKDAELLMDPDYYDMMEWKKKAPQKAPEKKSIPQTAATKKVQQAFDKDFKVTDKSKYEKAEAEIEKLNEIGRKQAEELGLPYTQKEERQTADRIWSQYGVYDPSRGALTGPDEIKQIDPNTHTSFVAPENLTFGDYAGKAWDVVTNPIDYFNYSVATGDMMNAPWDITDYEKSLGRAGQEDQLLSRNAVGQGLDLASYFNPITGTLQSIKSIGELPNAVDRGFKTGDWSEVGWTGGEALFDAIPGMGAIDNIAPVVNRGLKAMDQGFDAVTSPLKKFIGNTGKEAKEIAGTGKYYNELSMEDIKALQRESKLADKEYYQSLYDDTHEYYDGFDDDFLSDDLPFPSSYENQDITNLADEAISDDALRLDELQARKEALNERYNALGLENANVADMPADIRAQVSDLQNERMLVNADIADIRLRQQRDPMSQQQPRIVGRIDLSNLPQHQPQIRHVLDDTYENPFSGIRGSNVAPSNGPELRESTARALEYLSTTSPNGTRITLADRFAQHDNPLNLINDLRHGQDLGLHQRQISELMDVARAEIRNMPISNDQKRFFIQEAKRISNVPKSKAYTGSSISDVDELLSKIDKLEERLGGTEKANEVLAEYGYTLDEVTNFISDVRNNGQEYLLPYVGNQLYDDLRYFADHQMLNPNTPVINFKTGDIADAVKRETVLQSSGLSSKQAEVINNTMYKPGSLVTGTVDYDAVDDPIIHSLIDKSQIHDTDKLDDLIDTYQDAASKVSDPDMQRKLETQLEDLKSTKWLRTEYVKELEEAGLNPTKMRRASIVSNGRTQKNLVDGDGNVIGTLNAGPATTRTGEKGYVIMSTGVNLKFHPYNLKHSNFGDWDEAKKYVMDEYLQKQLRTVAPEHTTNPIVVKRFTKDAEKYADELINQLKENNDNRWGEALYRGVHHGVKDTKGAVFTNSHFAETDLADPITKELISRYRAKDYWGSQAKQVNEAGVPKAELIPPDPNLDPNDMRRKPLYIIRRKQGGDIDKLNKFIN